MSDTPSFLDATPAETAEFEAVRDAVETDAPAPAPAAETPKVEIPAEPAKAEPTKPTIESKDERPKFVPHAALHEERVRRQALEKEFADFKAAILAGKQPQAEPEKPATIDPETDPIAALKEVRAYQQQQREQGERAQQEQAFVSRVQTHEQDFAAATPDYIDAITHLRETRAAEIVAIARAMGQPLSQEQLGAQLRHEALATADVAFKMGKNPGEVFYELAKTKGYALKAAEPPKVAPPAPPSEEAVDTIDRITRGQRASAPRGGDSPTGGGELSLEDIGKLEGAAFDVAMEKFGRMQKEAERRMH